MRRTLYIHPLSTASRPVMVLCDEAGIEVETEVVDLMAGEQFGAEYRAVNPCSQVPTLVEDGFVLTESSAIMKYVATAAGSPLYPTDPRRRARVDERMDWFNTGFYREWGYHFVYPQVFDHHRRQPEECNDALISWGIEKSKRWLTILDGCYLADDEFLAGPEITIADLFGAAIVSLGEWIGQDVAEWSNIDRWVRAVKGLPSWARADRAYDDFVTSLSDGQFRRIEGPQ